MNVKRALISVSDKTGVVRLASFLAMHNVEILSTGGTARLLREKEIPVKDVSEMTGFPEMLDGRVKTLHPKVHGGLLYLRENEEHQKQVTEHGIEPIDLVIVNLYPFAEVLQKDGFTHNEAIENIDIGGPSMLRSAAKNYRSVTVVVDPEDYDLVEAELKNSGETSEETREKLAAKVFQHTSQYDGLIAGYLTKHMNPEEAALHKVSTDIKKRGTGLRYGENPHQKASVFGEFFNTFGQIHGKELSYNNIIDISAGARLMNDFKGEDPTLAILKHTNPCGVATAESLKEAWDLAFETDKQAPFGGIIVVNRPLDAEVAESIAGIFSEVIIAPKFAPDAREILQKKKNLRLIENYYEGKATYDIHSVAGGVLVQQADLVPIGDADWRVVTKREPTEEEMAALKFGWKVVKHVKSNAIVYAGKGRTLGIGAGQMSRVDSSRIAVWKAQEAGLDLAGSVVASDAFFPFADGIEAAANAGAKAAIQPGGSVRDEEVIEAANAAGMAMVFTGRRHFRH